MRGLSKTGIVYPREMDLLPLFIIISAILNLLFTVLWVGKASKDTRVVLNSLGKQLDQGIQDINLSLEPVINASSRSMGAISSLADDTKMEKALERRIGQDLMGKNEDILEMITMAFPRVSEYLDDHPEAITKLLPRLNTLLSDPETRKRLNIDFSNTKSDVSRIWREE